MGIAKDILILSFVFTFIQVFAPAYAAVKMPAKGKEELRGIETQMKAHGKLIRDLQAKIQKYENVLTSKNKKYLQVLEQRKQIEGAIDHLRIQIDQQQTSLKQRMDRASSVLNGVILSAIDDQHDSSNLISNKMLGAALKRRLIELRLAMSEGENQQRQLDSLQSSYQDLLKNEQELAGLLSQLEADKKVIVSNYETVSKQEEIFKSNYHKLKAKEYREAVRPVAAVNDKAAISFSPPIADFNDMNFAKKKGVSFYFRTMQSVLAPQDGKVVFKGTVGSFGQVIFIDHGNNLRSVILGHFDPKVEKDISVKRGDVLGYTQQMGSKIGEIYYEVREKNMALNTITLLDKKAINVR